MLTGTQIRAARALLGWTSPRLARCARIGFAIALKAQDDDGVRSLDSFQLRAIRGAFEKAGVEFTVDGPQLRKRQA